MMKFFSDRKKAKHISLALAMMLALSVILPVFSYAPASAAGRKKLELVAQTITVELYTDETYKTLLTTDTEDPVPALSPARTKAPSADAPTDDIDLGGSDTTAMLALSSERKALSGGDFGDGLPADEDLLDELTRQMEEMLAGGGDGYGDDDDLPNDSVGDGHEDMPDDTINPDTVTPEGKSAEPKRGASAADNNEKEEEAYLLTLSGEMPVGVKAKAYPAVREIDGEAYIYGFNIRLYLASGVRYKPENTLTVTARTPQIKSAIEEEIDISAYSLKTLTGDAKAISKYEIDDEEYTVSADVEALVFVIFTVTAEKEEDTGKGNKSYTYRTDYMTLDFTPNTSKPKGPKYKDITKKVSRNAADNQTVVEAYSFSKTDDFESVTLKLDRMPTLAEGETLVLYGVDGENNLLTDAIEIGLRLNAQSVLPLPWYRGYALVIEAAQEQQIVNTKTAELDGLTVTLMGVMPEDAVLTADTYEEEGALAAFALSLGDDFSFFEPLTVTISGEKMRALLGEYKEVGVEQDGKELAVVYSAEDLIRFRIESLSPIKLTRTDVVTIPEDALYANENIYLTGKMPKNGVIDVTPVEVEIEGETLLAGYDIKIYANANQKAKGKTWQPAGDKVQVHFYNERFGNGTVNVYHITDGAAPELVATTQAKDNWVEFEAGSFSIYAVTSSISRTIMASDGKVYTVTVYYDDDAEIPEGAQLEVTEVPTDDAYRAYLDRTAAALDVDVEALVYTKLFDISILLDGAEIQPKAPVQVTVELLEDDAKSTETLHVVHIGDEDEELLASTSGTSVTFRTHGFSIFSFVDLSLLDRIVSAVLGEKTGTLYENDDIILSGRMPALGIVEATRVEAQAAGKDALVAYDIKIYSSSIAKLFGITWQPTEGAITVTLKSDALAGKETLDVYHIPDGRTNAEFVKTAQAQDNAVTFDASSFSVYVIIDHEGGEVVTPRVEFHFIDRLTDSEYTNGAESPFSAPPYNYANMALDYQTTQILKNGEALERINNPRNIKISVPGADDIEKFFYGWYVVSLTSDSTTFNTTTGKYEGTIVYTWPDVMKIEFDTALTISYTGTLHVGNSVSWQLGDASGTGTLDADGTVDVYLAPLFQDFYFVNFRMGAKEDSGLANNLLTRKLIVFGENDSTIVRVGDVECPSSDPQHQIFVGWETVKEESGTLVQDKYYNTLDLDGNERDILHNGTTETPGAAGSGYFVTVTKSSSDVTQLDLYPIFAEARWMHFSTGKAGNGALYIASAYRVTNDEGAGNYFDNDFFQGNNGYVSHMSTRPGYDLEGWYLFAKMDEDGNITNLTTPEDVSVSYIENGEKKTVTVNTKAIKLVNSAGNIVYNGALSLAVSGSTAAITTSESDTMLFKVTGGEMYIYRAMDDITLYANWSSQLVDYTVVYWLENANDDQYTLMYYKVLSGVAGTQTAATEAQTTDTFVLNGTTFYPYSEYKLKFAHLAADQDKSKDGDQAGIQQQEIEGDGSTVVNVYYDRNVYTLRFDIGFARQTSTSGSTIDYTAMTASEAAAYSGTVYGVVNGSYVALDPDGNGGYTYAGTVTTRHDYTGYRYQATTGNTTPQYGVVGGSVVELSGSVSYSRTNRSHYTVSTSTSNGNYYIYLNGALTNTPLYYNGGRWYRTRSGGGMGGYTYSNEFTGTRFTWTQDGNNVVGTSYSGTLYYFDSNGTISTSGSGTPYGSTTNNQYFQLTETGSWTYNNGANTYPSGSTRYLCVANNDASTSYTLGFIGGSMQTVSHDAQGWYYNTQDAATLTYTGTLYKQTTMTGTWQYSVSNITGPNYANNNTWDQWLTQRRINLGTTNPFGPDEYTGTYSTTVGGTQYIVYYYDLVAKYGETIMDRYPGTQPARSGAGPFVGWLAQRDSYYNGRLSTSIKGMFETLSEDLILTGGTVPGYDATINNINPDNYFAVSLDDPAHQNNTITGEPGITQEFRCRYNTTSDTRRVYLYTIYLADPETRVYPSTPSYKTIVVGGSGSYPNLQTPPTFQGYSLVESKVLTSTGEEQTPGGSYSNPYQIQELVDAGVSANNNAGNGLIMVFRLQPNLHHVSYKYGSGADSSVINTEFGSAAEYYYDQSLANANIYNDTAIANTPAGHSFVGWYENPDGMGSAFNFNTTMPDGDIVLYAVYKPLKFRVTIDPNGGEIDHIDHTNASYAPYTQYLPDGAFNRGQLYYKDPVTGVEDPSKVEREADSGYRRDQSTYFNGTYGELVGEYTLRARNYVPLSEAAAQTYRGNIYYYVKTLPRGTDGSSLPSDLRNALYMTEDELHAYYLFYAGWTQGNLEGGYITGTTILDEDTWRQVYVSPQKYRAIGENEHWTFLGWYKVVDGVMENMPYNFSTPVSSEFTLRAMWRLDGGYKIRYIAEYTAENGDLINGGMPVWTDPNSTSGLAYSDGATTNIYKAPTDLTRNGTVITDDSVIFRGFRLVANTGTAEHPVYTPLEVDGEGNVTKYYYPGDEYTILAANADTSGTILLQAVYQNKEESDHRPVVTNLTLDANTGYISAGYTGHNPDLPAWDSYPGAQAVNTVDHLIPVVGVGDSVPTQIEFGDIQSEAAVHLYKYATDANIIAADGYNYFKHPDGYFLLGFDNNATEGDYIATYAADSVIAVDRNDDKTIYAVWEPMVYITFVNNTGVTANDLTFSLGSTDGSVLQIINVKNGMYDRTPLPDYGEITLKNGESVTLAFPYGAEKMLTVSGTNNLGVGKVLIWNSSIDLVKADASVSSYTTVGSASGSTSYLDIPGHTHILVSGEANNTKDFSFNETLIVNPNALTVTFTSRNNEYALLLDDNYAGGGVQEFDYGQEDIQPENGVAKTQVLPTTSTRIGYSFVGWATTPANAANGIADYSATSPAGNPWTITDLNKDNGFFSTNTVLDDGVITRTLYAVWEASTDAIYVYKDVPTPGNQKQAFTFTVAITGTYKYGTNGTSTETINKSGTFRLAHGEYLRISSSNYNGTPKDAIPVNTATTAYLQSVVQVFTQVTDANTGVTSYVEDTSRSAVIRWERSVNANTNNSFTSYQITVTETRAAYYDTSVTLSSEKNNNEITVDGSTYAKNTLPQTVVTNSFFWTNTDAGGTIVFTNQRQVFDVQVSKTLIANTSASSIFGYSAAYTETYTNTAGNTITETVDLDDFTVASGASKVLEDIPAGVALTITEATDTDDNYKTSITVKDHADAEVTAYGVADGKAVTIANVDDDYTVAYENTLKYYPVTFRLVDQDDNALHAMFALASTVGIIDSDAYAGNNGVFYTSPKFWCDTYTLDQTTTPTGYISLQGTPVTLTVTGSSPYIASDNSWVTVTGDPDQGFVITVKNWAQKTVTVKKVLVDPLLTSTRRFDFSYSYTTPLDGSTVSGTFYLQPVSNSTVVASRDLVIPVNAANLVITELTTGTYADIGSTYDTTVALDSETPTAGNSKTIASVLDDAAVTFTNTRKTAPITVKKVVQGLDTSRMFNFTGVLKNGNLALSTTDFTGKAVNGTDKTWTTNAGGEISFTLGHNQSIVIDVPVGATFVVTENGSDGYSTTITGGTVSNLQTTLTVADETALYITFTNTEVHVAPTGFNTPVSPYLWIGLMGLLLLLGSCVPAFSRRFAAAGEAAAAVGSVSAAGTMGGVQLRAPRGLQIAADLFCIPKKWTVSGVIFMIMRVAGIAMIAYALVNIARILSFLL